MNEVTFDELGTQRAELLPARETLWMHGLDVFVDVQATLAAVSAENVSQAVNAATVDSTAESYADQYINVSQ
ncbi:hypothetical protein [Kocuria sabuli]|uniref:hypothetical protein n=1 Tax=Kocuria sabuli TaxID=3071448 RepID=UPI0034D3F171